MADTEYTILEALTGEDRDIDPLRKSIPEDEIVKEVRELLGAKDEETARVLTVITDAHHYISLRLNSELTPGKKRNVPSVLVSDEGGMCLIPPANVEITIPKVSQEILVHYIQGEKVCNVIFSGYSWQVPCHYGIDRLFIHWPEELGIRGALNIQNKTQDVSFPISVRYPITSIVNKVKINEAVATLLERTGLYNEFFFADTDDEALGILVLALYTYINSYGRG